MRWSILHKNIQQVFLLFLLFVLTFSSIPGSTHAEEVKTYDPAALQLEVTEAINHVKEYYEQHQPYAKSDWKGNTLDYQGSHSDYWILSALWGAGYKDLKGDFPWKGNHPWLEGSYWTVQERTHVDKEEAGIIIGSVLLGIDPYDYGEENIVHTLLDKQQDNGLFYDVWGEAWALIALELVDADYDQDQHISSILSLQEDGVFADVDATGWLLMALSPYMNENKDVAEAIENSVAWAHDLFMEEDEFAGDYGANSNSTSSIIMGLAAVGEDLYSEKWAKESGSFVGQLLEYQQKDGSFLWDKTTGGDIEVATEQALLALSTLENKQSIFMDIKDIEINFESSYKKEALEENGSSMYTVLIPVLLLLALIVLLLTFRKKHSTKIK